MSPGQRPSSRPALHWSSRPPSHWAMLRTQNGEILYSKIGNGIPCLSATCASVSCNNAPCQDWYECCGVARFSYAILRASRTSSTGVGDTIVGCRSMAWMATGKTVDSLRLPFISSMVLERASRSLGTWGHVSSLVAS